MESCADKPKLSILNLGLGPAGAEKVISLLLKKLVDDYSVTLFLIFKERHYNIPEEVEVIGFTNRPSTSPMIIKIICAVAILFKYNWLLRKRKIRYAISFLPFPNFLNGISSMLHPSIKFLISERGFPSNNTSKKVSHYISKLFYPVFYNRCDKLFSNSVYINQDLKDNFGIKIPMEVIYNPIEIPKNVIESSKFAQKTGPINVITVGSLIPRKNQISIVKAIKCSKNQHNLSIIGQGNLKNDLISSIADMGLEKQVKLLGGGYKNVNEFLITYDCFVLSSNTEGFPNALLEAMAAGLPCISTNCFSGPKELLNENEDFTVLKGDFFVGKYGILVNVNDPEGLAMALDYLYENPKELERLSLQSLKRSKDYQLDNIYKLFNQFIIN
ncbi:glycosyltransferase [Flagellimonas olearia]|uniref:Glycosyltransferase n=1 Tax=Flagellimonas olearia TaxID=552546 RepID=A0A6I1DYT7_9FLAO|nr:glycosyltransferase [Allomuricauda olearia]KAB7530488.1 glycosyltransferase [Allomuricauda olearia]